MMRYRLRRGIEYACPSPFKNDSRLAGERLGSTRRNRRLTVDDCRFDGHSELAWMHSSPTFRTDANRSSSDNADTLYCFEAKGAAFAGAEAAGGIPIASFANAAAISLTAEVADGGSGVAAASHFSSFAQITSTPAADRRTSNPALSFMLAAANNPSMIMFAWRYAIFLVRLNVSSSSMLCILHADANRNRNDPPGKVHGYRYHARCPLSRHQAE